MNNSIFWNFKLHSQFEPIPFMKKEKVVDIGGPLQYGFIQPL